MEICSPHYGLPSSSLEGHSVYVYSWPQFTEVNGNETSDYLPAGKYNILWILDKVIK